SAAVPRYRSEIIFGLPSTQRISRRYQYGFPLITFLYRLAISLGHRIFARSKQGDTPDWCRPGPVRGGRQLIKIKLSRKVGLGSSRADSGARRRHRHQSPRTCGSSTRETCTASRRTRDSTLKEQLGAIALLNGNGDATTLAMDLAAIARRSVRATAACVEPARSELTAPAPARQRAGRNRAHRSRACRTGVGAPPPPASQSQASRCRPSRSSRSRCRASQSRSSQLAQVSASSVLALATAGGTARRLP